MGRFGRWVIQWDLYVLRLFFWGFVLTLLLLVMVITVSEITTRMNEALAIKRREQYFYLFLLYRIPRFISFAVPAAVMFAITNTVTALNRTNELLAIMATGISYFRSMRMAILSGIVITLALFAFNETVVGDAENKAQYYWRKFKKKGKFH